MNTMTTMKKCSACGLINADQMLACERCEKVLTEEESYLAEPVFSAQTEDHPSPPVPIPEPSIGGWLILIGIGLFLTPLRLVASIQSDLLPAFSEETWSVLTDVNSEVYHPLLAPLLKLELAENILLILYATLLLVLFFGKRRIFPKLMIVYLVLSLVFVMVDYFIGQQIPIIAAQGDSESVREVFRTTVQCLIWIPYFIVSERVKRTFIK